MRPHRADDGPHPTDVRVGGRLSHHRKLLGLTERQLAEALDLTVQQVREHEAGSSPIPASRLHDLARLLGVTVGFFFGTPPRTAGGPPDAGEIGDGLTHLPSADEEWRLLRQFARIADPDVRAFAIDQMTAMAEGRPVPSKGDEP
jgi:transcriptional regulator with XRE-family HTH domain